MKLSNEVRFGIIAVLTLGLVFYGLSYLSGNKFFGPPLTLYTQYGDLSGLVKGNPVLINGFKVGKVSELNLDMDEGVAKVRLDFDQELDIPDNSEAQIYSIDLLGSKAVKIMVPDSVRPSSTYLGSGQDILGTLEPSLLGVAGEALQDKGVQILYEVARLSVQLNEIVQLTKTLLVDENNSSSLRATINNIQQTSDNLTNITANVDSISGELTGMSRDAASIVSNFENNNSNITGILDNVKAATDTISAASTEVQALMTDASAAVENVETMVAKLDSTGGTLGLLLNDTQLYDSLTNTTENVNALLREIKANPQRFFDDIKLYINLRRPKEEGGL
ncbi:MAG: MlaD family protein [Bacteroidota bacterium]